jgi:hypothetical protein
METTHMEKRFGILAVEKGFITPEILIEALRIQVLDDVEKGRHRLLGRILLEQGHLDLDQIETILKELGKGIPLLREEK